MRSKYVQICQELFQKHFTRFEQSLRQEESSKVILHMHNYQGRPKAPPATQKCDTEILGAGTKIKNLGEQNLPFSFMGS